jgi:hypothetical protein
MIAGNDDMVRKLIPFLFGIPHDRYSGKNVQILTYRCICQSFRSTLRLLQTPSLLTLTILFQDIGQFCGRPLCQMDKYQPMSLTIYL